MSLWTIEALAAATGGRVAGNWGEINGLSIDSRDIAAGDLFVALKAARDGHEFVKNAMAAGATGALVSHIPEGCEEAPLLIVEDVETALRKIAIAARARTHAKTIAVTGSAGKTSTKEMLRAAFGALGRVHASVKSFNNHWGVPLSLARMPADTDYAIFEIGMNAPGEIAPLAALVKPDVAIITNVAPVHLAGFADEAGIAREKGSILGALRPDGAAIVFGDMNWTTEIATMSDRALTTFGGGAENHVILRAVHLAAAGSTAEIDLLGNPVFLKLSVAGKHHVMNALAVIAAVSALGADVALALGGLATWHAADGRGSVMDIHLAADEKITIIDESYNANPLSMRAALAGLLLHKTGNSGRHIAILGDMMELGETEIARHEAVASYAEIRDVASVHTIGTRMKYLADQLPPEKRGHHAATARDFVAAMPNLFAPGDVVMVKGSNSAGLTAVVKAFQSWGEPDTKIGKKE